MLFFFFSLFTPSCLPVMSHFSIFVFQQICCFCSRRIGSASQLFAFFIFKKLLYLIFKSHHSQFCVCVSNFVLPRGHLFLSVASAFIRIKCTRILLRVLYLSIFQLMILSVTPESFQSVPLVFKEY